MHLDKYKISDGSYKYEDIEYDSIEDLIHIGILGFCGCGFPNDSLLFIKDVLQHVKNLNEFVVTDIWTWEDWRKEGRILFPTNGSEYFAYYVLDRKDLLEHGSSVPGWLTEKGKELLEDLIELSEKLIKEG